MHGTARDPNAFAQELFRGLPPRYDALEALLSLGQNGRWRAEMIRHVEDPRPTSVLDVATGTAGVALDLVQRTPASVTGLDLTHEMLRRGRERVERKGETERVRLVAGQAERLPFPDATFDALTSALSMPFDCTLAKLNPDMTKLPMNCGGVILAVAVICASTSRTVQPVHSDGAAHWGSVSACRSAANAFRSAWMMPQTSVLTTGCPSQQFRMPR